MDILIWFLCGVIGGVLGATIVIVLQAAYEKRVARRLMARYEDEMNFEDLKH